MDWHRVQLQFFFLPPLCLAQQGGGWTELLRFLAQRYFGTNDLWWNLRKDFSFLLELTLCLFSGISPLVVSSRMDLNWLSFMPPLTPVAQLRVSVPLSRKVISLSALEGLSSDLQHSHLALALRLAFTALAHGHPAFALIPPSCLVGLSQVSYKGWVYVHVSLCISLLIFCRVVLSVTIRSTLKSPATIVELSVSTFSSVSFPSCILELVLSIYHCSIFLMY